MHRHPISSALLAASRLTGADLGFLQLVQRISSQLTGHATLADPAARERVAALHEEFRHACAAIFEKHLGPRQALPSLAALESAPLQHFLAARQAMAPALEAGLARLEQRMSEIEP